MCVSGGLLLVGTIVMLEEFKKAALDSVSAFDSWSLAGDSCYSQTKL